MGKLNNINKFGVFLFGISLCFSSAIGQSTDNRVPAQTSQNQQTGGLDELRQEISNELSRLRAEKGSLLGQPAIDNLAITSLDERIIQVEKQLARINQLVDKQRKRADNEVAAITDAELSVSREKIDKSQQRIEELERLLRQTNEAAQQAAEQAAERDAKFSIWELLGIASAILFGGYTLLNLRARRDDDFDDYEPELGSYSQQPANPQRPLPAQSHVASGGQVTPQTAQRPAVKARPQAPVNRAGPIAQAAALLAANKKTQAITILEQALNSHPDQGLVATRLLYLYRSIGDIKSFTNLYQSSATSIQQSDDWNKVRLMAVDYFAQHNIQADAIEKPMHFDLEPSEIDRPTRAVEQPAIDPLATNKESNPLLTPAQKKAPTPSSSPDLSIRKASDKGKTDDLSDSIIMLIDESVKDTVTNSVDIPTSPEIETDTLAGAAPQAIHHEAPEELSDSIIMMIDESLESTELTVPDPDVYSPMENETILPPPTEHPPKHDSREEEDDIGDFSDSIIMMIDESLNSSVTHDPQALLSQAKEYLQFGEKNIARDFLKEVMKTDEGEYRTQAAALLALLDRENALKRTQRIPPETKT